MDASEPPVPATVGTDGSDPTDRTRVSDGTVVPATGSRLQGWEAARVHVTLGLGLALCASAFWFEVGRALGGNSLSWAYVFEWPLLAAFAVYMWWNALHGGRTALRPVRRSRTQAAAVRPEHERMLRAWQAHQRELAATQAATDAVTDRAGAAAEVGRRPGPGQGPADTAR